MNLERTPHHWLRWQSAAADRTAHPELTAILLETLPPARWAALRLDNGDWDVVSSEGDRPDLAELDQRLGRAGEVIALPGPGLATAVGPVGWIAVGTNDATVAALLPIWAGTLDLHRQLHAATFWDATSLLGLAADDIAHDFSNALNGVGLQAAVVHMQAPATLKEAAAQVRARVTEAASKVRPLQQFRQRRREKLIAIDLGNALRGLPDLIPPKGPAPVFGASHELRRAASSLVECLAAANGPRPTLLIDPAEEGTALIVRIPGRGLEGAPPDDPLERDQGLWTGCDEVERLAVRSILRMHRANVHAEAGSDDVRVIIRFPVVKS